MVDAHNRRLAAARALEGLAGGGAHWAGFAEHVAPADCVGRVGPAGAGVDAVEPRAVALEPGVHEWFGEEGGGEVWLPPMAVLIDLAWAAVGRVEGRAGGRAGGRVVWVGRRCWAYPPSLVRRAGAGDAGPDRSLLDRALLDQSVFVDVRARGEGVWAIEQAARCAGVALVIGDGRGLSIAESRRLQLAASAGAGGAGGAGGTAVLLARPSWERGEISAARTRWQVRALGVRALPRADGTSGTSGHDTSGERQGWAVELLRCKGLRPEMTTRGARRWVVRRRYDTGTLGDWDVDGRGHGRAAGDGGVAAVVVDRSAAATRTA